MKKIAYYVLYSEQQISQFRDKFSFIPVLAINPSQIDSIDASLFFNKTKAFEKFNRQITNEEIAHTLSHIKCWREIAENNELSDEDFALIAESDIQLVNNFENLVQSYANKYPSYGIIKLQKNGEYYSNKRLFQEGDEPDAIIYGDINKYNNGCSLYLIRKDIAKKLSLSLNESKPYWLADHFIEFHNPKNIAQANYLLGKELKEKLQNKVENPLFSIIVPIYNVERYLEQSIKSVLAQDYHNYELILVDDGSPDNSIDICVKYAKKYKNIRFIHKSNGGLSDARNMGIKIARGEYIIFLDSDDFWQGSHILSDLQQIIFHDNPDVIFNYMSSVYPDHIIHHYIDISEETGDFVKNFPILYQSDIYIGFVFTKIVKRSLILDNNLFFIKGRLFEDVPWSFSLLKHIKSYSIYKSSFYMYRRGREGAITQIVTSEGTVHLFANFDSLIEDFKYISVNLPELKISALEYISKNHQYTMQCYDLLSDNEKEKLREVKEIHLQKWKELNNE